jgi:SAM-dependent methyltransferase
MAAEENIRRERGSTQWEAHPAVSASSLRAHYDGYYGDAALARRRTVMARKVCENLLACWRAAGKGAGPRRVADVGCGDGALLERLATQAFASEYTGFEISRSALECARRRHYAQPVTFARLTADTLPAADRQFDLCILSHVLEHADAPRTLLREAARIARYVYIETPLELNLRTRSDFQWKPTGHIQLFNPLLLRHLAQSCGLIVMDQRISTPHQEAYRHRRSPAAAWLRWALKRGALALSPSLASKLLYCNGSILARAETS